MNEVKYTSLLKTACHTLENNVTWKIIKKFMWPSNLLQSREIVIICHDWELVFSQTNPCHLNTPAWWFCRFDTSPQSWTRQTAGAVFLTTSLGMWGLRPARYLCQYDPCSSGSRNSSHLPQWRCNQADRSATGGERRRFLFFYQLCTCSGLSWSSHLGNQKIR